MRTRAQTLKQQLQEAIVLHKEVLSRQSSAVPRTLTRRQSLQLPFAQPKRRESVLHHEDEKRRELAIKKAIQHWTLVRNTFMGSRILGNVKILGKRAENTTANAIGFNLSSFKTNVSCTDNATLGKILSQSHFRELDEDELHIVFRLTSRIPAFAKYSRTTRKELCKVIKYMTVTAGKVVVQQNRPASYFYLILSGQVSVRQINKDGVNLQLTILQSGDSFGEIALLSDVKRAATVITLETTEFLMVEKQDFRTVLQASTLLELNEKIAIISSTPFFQSMTKEAIKSLAVASRKMKFKPNQVLVAEGDINENVYLICEGSCRAMKTVHFIRAPTDILPEYSVKPHTSLPSLPPIGPHSKSVDSNYKAAIQPKHKDFLLELDLTGDITKQSFFVDNIDLRKLKDSGSAKIHSHLVKLFDTKIMDIFGQESAIVQHSSKNLLRRAFPSLPFIVDEIAAQSIIAQEVESTISAATNVNVRESSTKPKVTVKITNKSSLYHQYQQLQRSPFSLVVNDEELTCLVFAPTDFAKSCTYDMAANIGKMVKAEGGVRSNGLAHDNAVVVDDGQSLLSPKRLQKTFLQERRWQIHKENVLKDLDEARRMRKKVTLLFSG